MLGRYFFHTQMLLMVVEFPRWYKVMIMYVHTTVVSVTVAAYKVPSPFLECIVQNAMVNCPIVRYVPRYDMCQCMLGTT